MFNKPCSSSVCSGFVSPVMAPHSSQGVHMNTLNCQKKKSDDEPKSVGWNVSNFGDGFLVLKRKERTVKDPLTVKSIFSLEHKKWKIVNGGTYFGWIGLVPFIES